MTEMTMDSTGDGGLTERLVKGFDHPLRKSILLRVLKRGEPASPNETRQELEVPVSNVSYHFDVLAKLKLIGLHHTRPRRGATEHFYEASPEILGHPLVLAFLEEDASSDD